MSFGVVSLSVPERAEPGGEVCRQFDVVALDGKGVGGADLGEHAGDPVDPRSRQLTPPALVDVGDEPPDVVGMAAAHDFGLVAEQVAGAARVATRAAQARLGATDRALDEALVDQPPEGVDDVDTGSAQTSSMGSSGTPDSNTPSRTKSLRSGSPSSCRLQSIVAGIVSCRSGASRLTHSPNQAGHAADFAAGPVAACARGRQRARWPA